MIYILLFSLFGYLSGSILFAKVAAALTGKGDITENSKDNNPGTANAFMMGGFLTGIIALFGDLIKGILPVCLYLHLAPANLPSFGISLVLVCPVLGHIFSVFYGFKGGKGIAVSFGSLLGLFPHIEMAWVLAAFFIFFSLIIRISPHFYRTLVTYLCSVIGTIFVEDNIYEVCGFVLITALITLKLLNSKEKREKPVVKFL